MLNIAYCGICTRYVGPTRKLGARIQAVSESRVRWYSYNELQAEAVKTLGKRDIETTVAIHMLAANRLASEMVDWGEATAVCMLPTSASRFEYAFTF